MNPFLAIAKNLDRERERWLLWAPVGMGAGIAFYFGLSAEPELWLLAASPILSFLAWQMRQHYRAFDGRHVLNSIGWINVSNKIPKYFATFL